MFEASNVLHSESKSNMAKRAILEYLGEYGEVRAAKLKREVCDKRGICSEKIFYRCLSELVKSKRIIKNEQSRGNVTYFTPTQVEYENRIDAIRMQQAAAIIKILAEVKKMESVNVKLWLLEKAFDNILDMYAGLIVGKMLQKKTSAVINNTLKQTIPELFERFENALEGCGKSKFTLLSSLISYEEGILGNSREILDSPEMTYRLNKQA